MIERPMDVLASFPIRKRKKQKQAFRDAVIDYASRLGLETTIERGSLGSRNIVIGDPKNARYLITAHYDTPPRLPFPNLITPCNLWTFIAYQLFITVLMLGFAYLCGAIGYLITRDFVISAMVGYYCLLAFCLMMMFGPANPTNANDNTSGVVTVLEIARRLPQEHRGKICFVLFDLEEAGMIGSASYRKAHKKESTHQIVLNMDCVGDGDDIILFPCKKLRKDTSKIGWLKKISGKYGQKQITVRDKGFQIYPSDQMQFPLGIGIAAFHTNKIAGPYCGRIHTSKDTILEEANVELLRDTMTMLIMDSAV